MTSTLTRFDASITRLGIVFEPSGGADDIEGVLNPAGARAKDGKFVLYPRLVAAGNVSRIGIARGIEFKGDAITFERDVYALEPSAPYEMRGVPGGMGCEDPRVTYIHVLERYLMAYTAFGSRGPRIAFAQSRDGYAWERIGLADFSAPGLPSGDDKDAAFFPEPVLSPSGVLSIAFYHRPMLHISAVDGQAAIPIILEMKPEDRESSRIAYVPLEPVLADVKNIVHVKESALVLTPDSEWGRIKNGPGTAPVRIAEGWFSLFHGVDAIENDGRFTTRYSAGFVIHDYEKPHVVLYRSPVPVLVPEGYNETHGTVNNVVFPTALDAHGERTFDVYYGMADAKIGRARLELAPAAEASESENAA